jgi:hypothetical protein
MSDRQPNYKVGYRKPPRETQFKKGQSGNPRGRPHGHAKLEAALLAAFNEKVTITQDGRRLKRSKLEVAVIQQLNKAATGDRHAAKFVTDLRQMLMKQADDAQANDVKRKVVNFIIEG